MQASFFLSLFAFAAAATETVEVASAGTGQTFDVNMSGLSYVPSKITIKVGDTVKWHFDGTTHSVTQADKEGSCSRPKGASGFDSGEVTSSTEVFTQTFDKAGKFPYYCSHSVHCVFGMKGVVTVQ